MTFQGVVMDEERLERRRERRRERNRRRRRLYVRKGPCGRCGGKKHYVCMDRCCDPVRQGWFVVWLYKRLRFGVRRLFFRQLRSLGLIR